MLYTSVYNLITKFLSILRYLNHNPIDKNFLIKNKILIIGLDLFWLINIRSFSSYIEI